MKLPEYRFGPVQRLGKPDPWAEIRAGRAVAAGLGRASSELDEIYYDLQAKKDDFQTKQADLAVATQMADLTQDLARAEADIEEVKDLPGVSTVDSAGNPRTSVPMHEVRAQLLEKRAREILNTTSGTIENEQTRTNWQTAHETVLMDRVAKVGANAIKEQREYHNAIILGQVNEARAAENGEALIHTAKMLPAEHPQRGALIHEGKVMLELDQYNADLMSEDSARLRKSADELSKTEGPLKGTDQQQQLVAKMRARAYTLDQREKAGNQADKTMIRWEAKHMKKTLYSGIGISKITSQEYADLRQDAKDAGMGDVYAELGIAMQLNPLLTKYTGMTDAQKIMLYEKVKNEWEDGPMKNTALEQMEVIRDDIINTNKRNQYEGAVKRGLVPPVPLAIDDPQRHEASLQLLAQSAQVIYSQDKELRQVMTDADAVKLAHYVQNLTHQEKVQEAAMIRRYMGPFAEVLFEQIKMGEYAKTWGVAGGLVLVDQNDAAELILRGSEARQRGEAFDFQVDTGTYREVVAKHFGNAYKGSFHNSQAFEQSVADAYSALTMDEGGSRQEFSEERYERAFNMVTGGFVEHKGNMIVPPVFGMTNRDFVQWLSKGVAPYMRRNPAFSPHDAFSDAMKVMNGKWQLRNIGGGSYVLYDVATDALVRKKDNKDEVYVLRYEPIEDEETPAPPPDVPIEDQAWYNVYRQQEQLVELGGSIAE